MTTTPTTLAELLGEDELQQFTELSCKHGDGWGAAWADGDEVAVVKAPDAAWVSSAYQEHVHGQAADLGLVHLRWATLGLEIRPDNTHPFTDGKVAFGHNGSIWPAAELDALVPAEVRGLQAGDTDSERYFLAALSAARSAAQTSSGDGVAEGLAVIVARIAAACEFTCLNAVVVTPGELIAVCRYDQAVADREADPGYFQLRYRVTDDSVVVSSSGWGNGWTPLGNGEILVVQRDTLKVSIALVPEGEDGQ